MEVVMYSIRQNGNRWEVLSGDAVIATVDDHMAALAALATASAPSTIALTSPPEGALPVRWRSYKNGEAVLTDTGDGRDFSECEFSYREGPLPLMLKISDGHGNFDSGQSFLAGWSDMNEIRDGVPYAEGWFHDNEHGNEFVRILKAQGRYGVSVDPGAMPDYEYECVEQDEDGFCVAEEIKFLSFVIGGRTGVPFQGFADAWIELDPASASEATDDSASDGKEGLNASGAAAPAQVSPRPKREPRPHYLTMGEPDDSDPRYVPQTARGAEGEIAIPLTILDPDEDGWMHAFGHYYVNGACHISYPNECVVAPTSPTNHANFNQFAAHDSEGGVHSVGNLVLGLEHADLAWSTQRAKDHYAHTGFKWAMVHASTGRHGGWFSGVVLPEVAQDPNAVRVLRASGVSGDWRWVDEWADEVDVFAIQSVNVPGFPVTRQVAAAGGLTPLADPTVRVVMRGGKVAAVSGAGIVERGETELRQLVASGTVLCPNCTKSFASMDFPREGSWRAARASRRPVDSGGRDKRLDRMESTLALLERRTRHLVVAEREHLAHQFGRSA